MNSCIDSLFSAAYTPTICRRSPMEPLVRSIKVDHCFCVVPTVPRLQTWVKWLNGPFLVWTEPFWDCGLTHNIFFHGYHMNSPWCVSDGRHEFPANSYQSIVNGARRPGASRVHNYHSVTEKSGTLLYVLREDCCYAKTHEETIHRNSRDDLSMVQLLVSHAEPLIQKGKKKIKE